MDGVTAIRADRFVDCIVDALVGLVKNGSPNRAGVLAELETAQVTWTLVDAVGVKVNLSVSRDEDPGFLTQCLGRLVRTMIQNRTGFVFETPSGSTYRVRIQDVVPVSEPGPQQSQAGGVTVVNIFMERPHITAKQSPPSTAAVRRTRSSWGAVAVCMLVLTVGGLAASAVVWVVWLR